MKTQDRIPHRNKTHVLLLLTAVMVGGGVAGWAAPPQKRDPASARGFERIGDFFFKFARKLEQTGHEDNDRSPDIIYDTRHPETTHSQTVPRAWPSTGLVLPPGYRAGDEFRSPAPSRSAPGVQRQTAPQQTARVEQFTPPNFQPNPQPRLIYPHQTNPAPRSSLTLPVPLPTSPSAETAQPQSSIITPSTLAPFDPPATEPAPTNPTSVQGEKPAMGVEFVFGTPVPGQRGFVYPPGAKHELQNMLDVRDFAAGQKVRDPRSGKMFLVPPR